jgi:hypothetical protein
MQRDGVHAMAGAFLLSWFRDFYSSAARRFPGSLIMITSTRSRNLPPSLSSGILEKPRQSAIPIFALGRQPANAALQGHGTSGKRAWRRSWEHRSSLLPHKYQEYGARANGNGGSWGALDGWRPGCFLPTVGFRRAPDRRGHLGSRLAPVLTGPHPGYKPRPNELISDSIIDILLDRGEGCDDAQWAHAIVTSRADGFDLAYTVRKLRQIVATYTPEARQAAEGELDDLSYSWPKIREGWPGPDKNTP